MSFVKKTTIALILIITFLATLSFGILVLNSKSYADTPVIVDKFSKDYLIYIQGKKKTIIQFREEFNTCSVNKTIKRCGLVKDTVTNITSTQKESNNLINKDIIEAITYFVENDKSNNIKIMTNWDSRYNNQELRNLIASNKNITISIDANMRENTTLVKQVTIKFDTKGGTKIKDIKVNLNETIKKPSNPKKKGYKFVEWQLNGKKYDFNKKAKKDITLVAKWKKKN